MAVDLSTKPKRGTPRDVADELSINKPEIIPRCPDHVTTIRRYQDQAMENDSVKVVKNLDVVPVEPAPPSWVSMPSVSSSGRTEFRIEDILKDDGNSLKVAASEGTSGYQQGGLHHYVYSAPSQTRDSSYHIRHLEDYHTAQGRLVAVDDLSGHEVIRYPRQEQYSFTAETEYKHHHHRQCFTHVPSVLPTNKHCSEAVHKQDDFRICGPRWPASIGCLEPNNYDSPVIVYPSMPKRLKELILRDPKRHSNIIVDPEEHHSIDHFDKPPHQMSLVYERDAHPISAVSYHPNDVTLYPTGLAQSPMPSRSRSSAVPHVVVPGAPVPQGLMHSRLTPNGCSQISANEQVPYRNPLIMGADPAGGPVYVSHPPPEDPRLHARIHHADYQNHAGDVIPAEKETVNHVMFWTDRRHPNDVSVRNVVPEVMMRKCEDNTSWRRRSVGQVTPNLDLHRNKVKPYNVTWNDSVVDLKRPRTSFTDFQLFRLREEFRANCYLSEERRLSLAKELGLGENQIKIWFQNNRAKLKKASYQKGDGSNGNNEYK